MLVAYIFYPEEISPTKWPRPIKLFIKEYEKKRNIILDRREITNTLMQCDKDFVKALSCTFWQLDEQDEMKHIYDTIQEIKGIYHKDSTK